MARKLLCTTVQVTDTHMQIKKSLFKGIKKKKKERKKFYEQRKKKNKRVEKKVEKKNSSKKQKAKKEQRADWWITDQSFVVLVGDIGYKEILLEIVEAALLEHVAEDEI